MSRQRNRRLSVQSLESRKLMAADAGFQGADTFTYAYAEVSQVTDKEIIDALNNGTQLTSQPLNTANIDRLIARFNPKEWSIDPSEPRISTD